MFSWPAQTGLPLRNQDGQCRRYLAANSAGEAQGNGVGVSRMTISASWAAFSMT